MNDSYKNRTQKSKAFYEAKELRHKRGDKQRQRNPEDLAEARSETVAHTPGKLFKDRLEVVSCRTKTNWHKEDTD